jgi:hypothetical protein
MYCPKIIMGIMISLLLPVHSPPVAKKVESYSNPLSPSTCRLMHQCLLYEVAPVHDRLDNHVSKRNWRKKSARKLMYQLLVYYVYVTNCHACQTIVHGLTMETSSMVLLGAQVLNSFSLLLLIRCCATHDLLHSNFVFS